MSLPSPALPSRLPPRPRPALSAGPEGAGGPPSRRRRPDSGSRAGPALRGRTRTSRRAGAPKQVRKQPERAGTAVIQQRDGRGRRAEPGKGHRDATGNARPTTLTPARVRPRPGGGGDSYLCGSSESSACSGRWLALPQSQLLSRGCLPHCTRPGAPRQARLATEEKRQEADQSETRLLAGAARPRAGAPRRPQTAVGRALTPRARAEGRRGQGARKKAEEPRALAGAGGRAEARASRAKAQHSGQAGRPGSLSWRLTGLRARAAGTSAQLRSPDS